MLNSPAVIEAARAGATTAGHFSPIITGMLTIAIGLLGVILRFQLANRKLSIGVNGEVRKEIIDQLNVLRGDNETLRDEIRLLRTENDHLRNEVRNLHGIIDGMRRESMQVGFSTQRAVVDSLPRDMVPQATRDALDRIAGTGEKDD